MGSAAKALPLHWLPSRPVSGIIRSIHSERSIRSPVTIGFAHAELIAVLVAVTGDEPRVMTIRSGNALPSGPFEMGHRTLQSGLREWVQEQTEHPVGYLEQLYTFADRDRNNDIPGGRTISISYLGLVNEQSGAGRPGWHGWYEYFPWEDHRQGRPAVLDEVMARLRSWADADPARRGHRHRRADFTFGLDGGGWNEDLALQRYELLYEAGLVSEAGCGAEANLGRAMFADHRRILATGIARLRAKIKYRPVVFELMPESFTLLRLQRTIEALAGLTLHKQNFRRLIEQQELVEETGGTESETGGRPAKLFRFRHTVLEERALAGTKLPLSRN
ncbi:NUDIX hydrolase [Rhizobium leguminosarum]|uniref:NUDIX hydrolase n=1 Tax=Rhizobium leguminosarum TaxID=384 RepID=UPI003F94A58B